MPVAASGESSQSADRRLRCRDCCWVEGEWRARCPIRGILEIDTAAVLFGDLPYRVLGMVVEWAASHRAALEQNSRRARARMPLLPIPPLE